MFLAGWFGTGCQYSFLQSNETATFYDITMSQFKRKINELDRYEILKNPSLLTCYEGLRCHSMICLDWRQICDRNVNCENGEDEPKECLMLETNQCENDEHRCRSGMCIPKTFLIDFSVDCMDLSDEPETYISWSDYDICGFFPKLVCDFVVCKVGYFSCGDGQCILLSSSIEFSWCHSGRDLLFRRSLLLSAMPNGGINSNNISSECWYLMVCLSETNYLYRTRDFDYYKKCECLWTSVHERRC
jgi:hypothetical protein